MDRTRIRWRNVGRLVAGLAGVTVLIAVLPGLLEPAGPPPLPPDVGLETGASGAYAYAATPGHGQDRRERRERGADPARHHDERPHAGHRPPAPEASPSRDASPPPASPPPPPAAPSAPSPPTPAPPPATAPPPPPPPPVRPPTPPVPAPPVAQPDHASAAYDAAPTRPQTASAPSQFGFEH